MRLEKVHSVEESSQKCLSVEVTLEDVVINLVDHQSNIIHAPILRPKLSKPSPIDNEIGRTRSLPNIGPTPPLLASESSQEKYKSTHQDSGSLSDEDETDEDETKIQFIESRDECYTQSERIIDQREQSLPSDQWVQNILNIRSREESSTDISDAISSSLHGDESSERLSPESSSTKRRKCGSILKKARYSSDCDHRTEYQSDLKPKFSTLEIREYPVALGDNPGGVAGPPICLDWKHDEERTLIMPLEEFESKRAPRREEHELWIPECLRRWRLLDRGVSMRSMQRATKKAENTRRQRKSTIQKLRASPEGTSGYFSGIKDIIKYMKG